MLNSSLITLICVQALGAQGNYSPACSKAVEATTIQTGVKGTLDGTENYVQGQVRNRVPHEVDPYVAIAYMAYQKTAKAQFHVRLIGADLGLEASPDSGKAFLSWHF